MMTWEELKVFVRMMHDGAQEWGTECEAFGASLRELAFGGLRLGSALASIGGAMLTELAAEAEQWLAEQKRSNASMREVPLRTRQGT